MATRFVTATKSTEEAINALADSINQLAQWADNALTTGSITLTAAQMVNADIRQSGQAGAINYTTPTAAALVAAIKNAQAGSTFEFMIVNGNTSAGAITILAGTGVTLVGTTAAAITTTRKYRGIVTNATAGAEAVSLVGLGYLTAP